MVLYSEQEVKEATLKYFDGDDLATGVWISKYALRDKDGNLLELTPEDMHRRIAKELARIESKYPNPLSEEYIFSLLKDFKYVVPQGSNLFGIGNSYATSSISNCFVIGDSDADSYSNILLRDEEMVHIMKQRGGVGHDISFIRPNGAYVSNAAKTSTGVVSFAERFSNTTREVAQSGRRGALLLSLSVYHPDVLDFMDAKLEQNKITGANISIRVDDLFKKSVDNDDDIILRFPIDTDLSAIDFDFSTMEYRKMYSVKDKSVYLRKEKAVSIWNKIIANVWKSAEPGLLNWDLILRESPADMYSHKGYKTVSTNPCFTGDMELLTSEGYKTFSELNGTNFIAIDSNGNEVESTVWSNGVKNIVSIKAENGVKITCTPDHKFMLHDGQECLAKDLLEKKIKAQENIYYDSYLVESVSEAGKAEVFDFTLKGDNHWGFVEGVVAHNCGELTLCAYDSCRLLLLYLLSFVKNPYMQDSFFDFEEFKKISYEAQRLMDDIVDLELEKIQNIIDKIDRDNIPPHLKITELELWEKILNKCKNGRRSGLGITAEGDMLAALGYKYGTPEATDFVENLHKVLAVSSYKSSIDMADERGAFPVCDLGIEKNPTSDFIKRIKEEMSPEYIEKWNRVGRRNIGNLTLSPAGSVSILAGNCSSGIEPCFMVTYKRRRKVSDKSLTTFIDDMGDMYQEYSIFHSGFIKWFKVAYGMQDIDTKDIIDILSKHDDETIKSLIKESPYYEATSNDVDWVEKVRMQGRVQKWIDHSISCTVNVPNKTTVETVDKIYRTALESGCKGVTLYRDGSRSGVLVSNDKKEPTSEFPVTRAPKRPKSLKADYFYTTAFDKESGVKREFGVVIGIMDGNPYEIFAFDNPTYKQNTKGEVIKVGKGAYKFTSDKFTVDRIDLSANLEREKALTLWLSMALRHGVQLQYIVKNIDKYSFEMNSFAAVIKRQLKKYIKDGVQNGEVCPECGSKMTFENGCIVCKNCGYSKCG